MYNSLHLEGFGPGITFAPSRPLHWSGLPEWWRPSSSSKSGACLVLFGCFFGSDVTVILRVQAERKQNKELKDWKNCWIPGGFWRCTMDLWSIDNIFSCTEGIPKGNYTIMVHATPSFSRPSTCPPKKPFCHVWLPADITQLPATAWNSLGTLAWLGEAAESQVIEPDSTRASLSLLAYQDMLYIPYIFHIPTNCWRPAARRIGIGINPQVESIVIAATHPRGGAGANGKRWNSDSSWILGIPSGKLT